MNLHFTATTGHRYLPQMRKRLQLATPLLPRNALTEISIALIGDTTMSRLHQQFMDIPGPTDVLTFPLDVDAKGRTVTGEILVCVPEAVRRTRQTNISLADELLLYSLHGILHLCGLDDRTDGQFTRMHRTEDDILRRIGVGAVFHHPANQPAPLGRNR